MTNVVKTDWFKRELKENGLTQKQLAEKLDFEAQNITHIFGGKRVFRVDEIGKIAKILNVPASFVLASSTNEVDFDAEAQQEAEMVEFAIDLADKVIERSNKEFDTERSKTLTSLIYKIARKHQYEGTLNNLNLDSLELAFTMAK